MSACSPAKARVRPLAQLAGGLSNSQPARQVCERTPQLGRFGRGPGRHAARDRPSTSRPRLIRLHVGAASIRAQLRRSKMGSQCFPRHWFRRIGAGPRALSTPGVRAGRKRPRRQGWRLQRRAGGEHSPPLQPLLSLRATSLSRWKSSLRACSGIPRVVSWLSSGKLFSSG
jgi:hypothetical protein